MLALLVLILCKNKQETITIPNNSIRIRIIANSNSQSDILEKLKIKNEVEKQIYKLLSGVKDIKEARNIIELNKDKLNISVENNISYGYNYFPRKVYKNIIYESGIYESLVITLGSGNGDNFWCVLFPPLCLLEENDTTSDVEYSFFVKELLNKYK